MRNQTKANYNEKLKELAKIYVLLKIKSLVRHGVINGEICDWTKFGMEADRDNGQVSTTQRKRGRIDMVCVS